MSRVRYQTILIESFSRLILEGRKDDVLKKYPEMKQEIERFVQTDPTNNLKYLNWQANLAHQGADPEQLVVIASLFEKYGKSLAKKDISSWTIMKLDQLQAELEEKSNKNTNQKQDKDAAHCQQKVIFENSDFIVRHIMGKKASIHYGKGTKWCITMADQTHYEDYVMNNVVFFFVTRKQQQGDDYDKMAVSIQRDEFNAIVKAEYWNAIDEEVGEYTAEKTWRQSYGPIDAAMKQVCATYPASPLARMFNGSATSEEKIAVYNDEMGKGHGIFSRSVEVFVKKILKSKEEFPSEIIDDIGRRCMSQYYLGDEKYEIMSLLADRSELSLDVWTSLFYAKFDYRDEKLDFMEKLFATGGPVPPDVIEDIINKITSDPSAMQNYEIDAIKYVPNLSREQQIDLAWGVEASRNCNNVFGALIARRQPLDPSVIDLMADRLVAFHKASFRPGVLPDDRTETAYTNCLKKLLYRDDVTDHAKQVAATIPLIKQFFRL